MKDARMAENPLSCCFGMRRLLKFALPTILTMIFMGLYTVTDTVFVARLVNTDALSALNIVCPVINLIVGFGTMLAAGGSAVIARKMGEGKSSEASRDFTLIICAGALSGILIAAFGIIFIDDIIRTLGASAVLFEYCREYLFTLLLFTPASILQVLFQNLTVTAGRPGIGMILGISAGTANILLDYIFMSPVQMGIKGAALGTGAGYMIPAMAGVLFFAAKKSGLRFKKPSADIMILKKSFANGFSEMISQAAAAVTTFLFNLVMMRLLGEDGVAAITVIIYTQFLLTALFMGFSMGTAPVISYNYGRRDGDRLKKTFGICVRFIIITSVAVFAAALGFGSDLAGIFAKRGTAVYEIARRGFLIFPFGFLFSGFNIFASAAFTALSDGKRSAVISFLRTFGLIAVFLLTLPEILGVTGVWLAAPAAEFITMIVSLIFIYRNKEKYLGCR